LHVIKKKTKTKTGLTAENGLKLNFVQRYVCSAKYPSWLATARARQSRGRRRRVRSRLGDLL